MRSNQTQKCSECFPIYMQNQTSGTLYLCCVFHIILEVPYKLFFFKEKRHCVLIMSSPITIRYKIHKSPIEKCKSCLFLGFSIKWCPKNKSTPLVLMSWNEPSSQQQLNLFKRAFSKRLGASQTGYWEALPSSSSTEMLARTSLSLSDSERLK